ncbi:AAA family ATPase [Candidatus Woesearchaeota archaeon]|nr:AAA family ATPase [Candidatus Woesearchaeota archaeon]
MKATEELKEYNGILDNVRKLPKTSFYHNSTPVINVSGENLIVWDVLTASLIGNLNALVIGERGEGKTQLLNELRNVFFGGNATYIRMRDNIRTKDLYEVYDLGKLFGRKEGKVTDAKELTGATRNALTIIDEINRAHEKVQNQVFDIYDGYIIFEGKNGTEKINLGIKVEDDLFFHSAVASANVGGNRYTGISPIDPALLDRSHLILNIDNYATNTLDNILIIDDTKTTKIVDHQNSDHTAKIVDIYKQVKDVKLTLDGLTALLYLKKGLDNCINPENPTKSKLPILASIPDICEGCRELGEGCGYIRPISVRTEKAVLLLAKSLKVVADAKSGEKVSKIRVNYQDVLSAFTLVGPYSDILDERWVNEQFLRNQHFAINTVVNKISGELRSFSSVLQKSLNESVEGKLSNATRQKFSGRWGWYSDFLVSVNDASRKYGNLRKLNDTKLEEVVKEYPVVKWLR